MTQFNSKRTGEIFVCFDVGNLLVLRLSYFFHVSIYSHFQHGISKMHDAVYN